MWDNCIPITVFFYTYQCTGWSILIIAPNFPTCQNPGKKVLNWPPSEMTLSISCQPLKMAALWD